jgi:hypothetical protein
MTLARPDTSLIASGLAAAELPSWQTGIAVFLVTIAFSEWFKIVLEVSMTVIIYLAATLICLISIVLTMLVVEMIRERLKGAEVWGDKDVMVGGVDSGDWGYSYWDDEERRDT